MLTVHEVGRVGDVAFIAMEFAAGGTLTHWLRAEPRPWRAVIERFVHAGRGLVAAHEAGLVHRDFKPDNVLLTAKGEVRVADFGLVSAFEPDRTERDGALSASTTDANLTHAGAIMGTPAYMAPEQIRGDIVDARADQFAFCVALWEALYGERPFQTAASSSIEDLLESIEDGKLRAPPSSTDVPPRIRDALMRGLAAEPGRRWPSMAALLAILEPTQHPRARWVVGATALVAVAAGGLAIYSFTRPSAAHPCSTVGDRARAVWSDGRKAEIQKAIAGSHAPFASEVWQRVEPVLGQYTNEWIDVRMDACVAHEDRQRSDEIMDRQMSCLDMGLAELDAFARLLATGDLDAIRNASTTAANLPSLSYCADTAALLQEVPPLRERKTADAVARIRKSLAEAEVLEDSGQYQRAADVAKAAAAAADGLKYPPVLAEARLRLGDIDERLGSFPAAEQELRAAYFAAAGARHDRVAAKAASSLVDVIGFRAARTQDALEWSAHASAATERVADDRARADLASSLAGVYEVKGDYEQAEAQYRNALAIGERVLAPSDPQLGHLIANVGHVLTLRGRYDDAIALLQRALTVFEQRLGPHHPDVAGAANNIAQALIEKGEYGEAVPYLDRSLAIKEAILGPDHPDLVPTLGNFANVLQSAGEYDKALEKARRALAIAEKALGPDHPTVALLRIVEGNAYYGEGKLRDAEASFEAALAIQLRTVGPDHPDVASSYDNIGSTKLALGDAKGALEDNKRALAIRQRALGPDHPGVATTLVNVGQATMALGDFAEARSDFERSISIYEKASGPDFPDLAFPLSGLGDAWLGLHHPENAIAPLERALRLREKGPADPADVAQTKFRLAIALWDAGQDRHRALALAQDARREMASAGEQHRVDVAPIDEWLESHAR